MGKRNPYRGPSSSVAEVKKKVAGLGTYLLLYPYEHLSTTL